MVCKAVCNSAVNALLSNFDFGVKDSQSPKNFIYFTRQICAHTYIHLTDL